MNKKKKIFFIIVGIIILLILLIVFALSGNKGGSNTNSGGNFIVWLYDDNKDTFSSYLEDFKADSGYNGINPVVESFDDWEEYNLALSAAFAKGEAPDLFVLNNNEASIFLENIVGVDPQLINSDDFRNNYEGFFGDDLITSIGEGEETVEFLLGVPVGYQSLGIYYNRSKGIEADDMKNWASVNAMIAQQKDKRSDIVPLGLGKGTTVRYAEDIATQFFMLENKTSLSEVEGATLKSALSPYFEFAKIGSGNEYDSKFESMLSLGRDNLDLFIRGEILSFIGYPSTIYDLDNLGFKKLFLYAKPFPDHFESGKALVDYNYFVVNKDSQNKDVAMSLLKYMTTSDGASKYLDKFPYYLPGLISIKDEYLDKKILSGYNVKLKDFYNEDLELSSFDKGVKTIYDREIINVLDDGANYVDNFDLFRNSLTCIASKLISLEGLSVSCK